MWAAVGDRRLTPLARAALEDLTGVFSSVSIFEIAVKGRLGRSDFQIHPFEFRQELIVRDFTELPLTGLHAAAVGDIPVHHRDPFDHLLIAQARVEGLQLMTADPILAQYGSSVHLI